MYRTETTFPTNPQYQFDVMAEGQGRSMVVVGIMQKALRERKLTGGKAVAIGYRIYKVTLTVIG